MSYIDFGILLYDNIQLYIAIFLCTILLYWVLFHNLINSILDPFFMSLFSSAAGFSVVWLLYLTNTISVFYFYQYLITQILFWIGFFLLSKKNCIVKSKAFSSCHIRNSLLIPKRYYRFYVIISLIYILLQLYTYKIVGIPLFKEYRLAAVGIGGGFGIINRFIGLFSLIVFYFTCLFFYTPYRSFAKLILSCIIIFGLLSGSRSSLLGIFMNLFLFYVINRDIFATKLYRYNSKARILFIAGAIGAVGVLLVTSESFAETFEKLFFRIVSSGDVYYMAYCNDIIEQLSKADWWVALTGDLFRTLRLIPEEKALPGMGFELFNIVNGVTDALGGPNPRHNVFGYVHFGLIGGAVYSLGCGMLLGYLRTKIFVQIHTTHYRRMILFILYLACIKLETDPPAFLSLFNDMLLLLTFTFFVENIFYKLLFKKSD